jgi:hypothetical protein
MNRQEILDRYPIEERNFNGVDASEPSLQGTVCQSGSDVVVVKSCKVWSALLN